MAKPRRAKNAHPSDCFEPPRLLDERDQRRQALLDKAKLGSREALGALFTEHLPMMRSFILGRLPRQLAAKVLDDLTQDTYLKATAAFAKFVGEHVAQFTNWLMKICHGVLGDFVRNHQRAARHELSVDDVELEELGAHGYGPRQPSADEVFVALETAGLLLSALNRLPADERQIVLWRVSDKLPFVEIAARLVYSNDAVERAFKHALAALRKNLARIRFA